MDSREEEYLQYFKTLPPDEQKHQVAIMVQFLLNILRQQQQEECDRVASELLADLDIDL